MDYYRTIRALGFLGKRYGRLYQDAASGDLAAYLPPVWGITVPVLLGIALLAYLLGSVNFAVLISNKSYHEDIRSFGSKNAGTTNMMRTYGKKAAILTLLGDLLKGLVACVVGSLLLGQIGGYVAALFAVIGHMYPVWFRFKGGKGIATTAGVILWLSPVTFLILMFLFVALVLWTKYISLGSIMGMLMYPLILNRFSLMTPPLLQLAFPGRDLIALAIMALTVWKHKENIIRLWNGKENKFSLKSSKKPEEVEKTEKSSEKM